MKTSFKRILKIRTVPVISRLTHLWIILLLIPAVLAATDERRGIPMVRTWEQLEALPKITVAEGVTVRIGIEAQRVKRNSGCLIYCLSEGWPRKGTTMSSSDALGPVRIRVLRHGDLDRPDDRVHSVTEPLRDKGPHLFIRTIPIQEADTYTVTVLDRQGELLASSSIRSRAESAQAWTTFSYDEPPGTSRGNGNAFKKSVKATANTMGLPHRISSAPFQRPAHRKVTESDVETPLPTLFPSMVDAGFRLRLRGDTFQIRYSTPTILNDPRGHILARWWINGEAFNPTMIEEPAGQKDVAERVRIGRALDLHVTFNSRQFGAQKGDRIGVQLMFCPDGWISPGRDRQHQLRLDNNSVDSISRMSDKVEFTVP